MLIKEKLLKLRKSEGITQDVIAKHLHISRSTYTYYESGKTSPSLEQLRSIANFYGISFYSLVKDME